MADTKYSETYQAEQLLRLLENTDGPDRPVCVEHRDKPDFVLSTRFRKIGLETTSFTDEEVMRADYLHRTFFPQICITTTGLRDGPSRRSSKDIAESMLIWGAQWESVTDGAVHVARKILERIGMKRRKFHSPTFEKFDQNWLLLTDCYNDFSNEIIDGIIAKQLTVALQLPDTIGTEFDRIYILYGPRCFRIQNGKLATKLDRKEAY